MTDYRVIVTAWRDWPESHRDWIWLTLHESIGIPNGHRLVLVHGQCPTGGGDLWADQWGRKHGFEVERHPADWDRFGKAAGPRRNSHMVSLGVDRCFAFPGPGSRGTWDCARKASEAGARVEVFSWAEVLRLEAAGVRPDLHLL